METQTAAPTQMPYARIRAWLRGGQLLPWLVLAISLLITQQLWKDARQTTMKELQAEFDFGVREAGIRTRQRMAAHEQVLRGVHGLFGASTHVDRNEFKTYVRHLQLDESYAGIDGVGFSQIVPSAEKSKHVTAIRNEGFPGYTIKPAGNRDVYAPVVYIEPFVGRNLRIFGFDPYAKPEHRAAMELARDSDKAAITGKVSLEREPDSGAQASIVMYMPVYRNAAPYASRVDRRANIVGWVFAPFSMSSLMSGILGNHSMDFDIEIYDGTKILGEALISDDDAINIFRKPGVLFKAAISLGIAGRDWTMLVSSHPAFEARLNKGKPKLIAGIGIAASLLLALFTWLLVRGRMRALQAAQGLEWELAARKKLQATLRESEERWRFALEGGGEGVWDWNIQTSETLYSRRWKEILCFYEDETWDNPDEWMSRVHPEDKPSAMSGLQAHFDRKTAAADCEFRMLCNGGKWKWVHCRGMVVSRDANDKPLRFVGTIADITERRAREDDLQLAATVFNIVDGAIVVTGPDNLIVAVNPAFTAITGYSPAEAIGKNPNILSSGLQQPEFYKEMWGSLNTSGSWNGEICNRRKDGKTYVEWLSIKSVHDQNGNISRYVGAFSDISVRKAAEERMDHSAHYDTLTDLPNRSLFTDRLRQALAQTRRDKESLAVMFLDLDKFKPVNDTLGHNTGDLLLKDVATRLQACMQRGSDTVSRFGGDEFMILLSHIDEESDAVMVAEKILSALNRPFKIGTNSIDISASIGIAIYPQHGKNAEQLITSADIAMYHVKKNGRNGYRLFSDEMDRPSVANFAASQMQMLRGIA
ncbi:MAG: CHASE domain-containing protein [Gallionella sp.]|nr:CHASE domain-containing protein [Gallionella sp.]